jgi:gamma-glutamylcyclotransferase
MYVAEETHIVSGLKPYSWYKHFVLEGAREHGVPAEYVMLIEVMPADEDPDRDRDAENRRLATLEGLTALA